MVEASDKDPTLLTLSIVNVGPGLQYHAVDANVDPKELDESCGTSSMVRVQTAMTIPVSKARMSNDGSLWFLLKRCLLPVSSAVNMSWRERKDVSPADYLYEVLLPHLLDWANAQI